MEGAIRPAAKRLCALAVLVSVALPLAPADASASTPHDRWARLADRIAYPWLRLQRSNGTFVDRVRHRGRTRYGEAFLGYGLLQAGLRRDDRRLVNASLRAMRFSLSLPTHFQRRQSDFESLALPAAYNLARREAGGRAFRALRRAWVRFLVTRRAKRVGVSDAYNNHVLADAVGLLEQFRSGVRSRAPSANLSARRARLQRLTRRIVNVDVPRLARRAGVRAGAQRAALLSDPPSNALAYQGLTLGLYARAIRLLGRRAGPAARRTLRQLANASWALAAPDGDLAYWGRSQEAAWALSFTAYGAEVAARLPGSSARLDARYRALADRALGRLETLHLRRGGLAIVPALYHGGRAALRGLDRYATGPAFTGLTLVGIEWTLAELRGRPRVGRLAAERRFAAALGHGESRFGVVRRGPVWFAVRMTPSRRWTRDLRYDFGLVALKTRDRRGRWRDVLPLRPRTAKGRGPVTGTGPALTRASAGARGRSLRVTRGGTVVVRGDFANEHGGVRRAWFRFRPVGCGVELAFPVRGGERIRQTFFFRARRRRPAVGRRSIADRGQRISFSLPVRVRRHPLRYASGRDARLFRLDAALGARSNRVVRVRVCRR